MSNMAHNVGLEWFFLGDFPVSNTTLDSQNRAGIVTLDFQWSIPASFPTPSKRGKLQSTPNVQKTGPGLAHKTFLPPPQGFKWYESRIP